MVRKNHVGGLKLSHRGGVHGAGIQKKLIEAGKKVESAILPSLPLESLKRLESLKPKSLIPFKRGNIKF